MKKLASHTAFNTEQEAKDYVKYCNQKGKGQEPRQEHGQDK